MSILALSKDFSAVSAGGSEVIAASVDRQFHNFPDFADLSASSKVWRGRSLENNGRYTPVYPVCLLHVNLSSVM